MSNETEMAGTLAILLAEVGNLPISEEWMYSAIRHCQRNMDFDINDGGNEPDRSAGTPISQIINILPDVIAEFTRLQSELTAAKEALVQAGRKLMSIEDTVPAAKEAQRIILATLSTIGGGK
jgi:hypothetical protein